MHRVLNIAAGLVVASAELQAQRPPSTDIFLAPLSMQDGRPVIGTPTNGTNRPGYDNQPSFTPDGHAFLFTSTHDDGQSDIYRYDLETKEVTRITTTPESEYSATVMPGGKRFSVVRVESDSTQRLWSFALDGSDPELLLETVKPVGYYAWIDANNLALFVLGKPNALVHADIRTGRADTLSRDIGRSLQPLPSGGGFSFVAHVDSVSSVRVVQWPANSRRAEVALPRGGEDFAWVTRDVILASSGSKLLYWHRGDRAMANAADFSESGIGNITRLAVSPDKKWLAFVAIPKSEQKP
jgi:dipeptidyl aminopeptidase/acylaminoacyl peptidase